MSSVIDRSTDPPVGLGLRLASRMSGVNPGPLSLSDDSPVTPFGATKTQRLQAMAKAQVLARLVLTLMPSGIVLLLRLAVNENELKIQYSLRVNQVGCIWS